MSGSIVTTISREEVLRHVVTDFDTFARHCLKIQTKDFRIAPLLLNRAQEHARQCLDRQAVEQGYVRALILKGRLLGMGLAPGTLVALADGQSKPIEELRPGDEILDGEGGVTDVEVVAFVHRPAYRIDLAGGSSVVCSGEHRWLTPFDGGYAWRAILPGDGLPRLRVGEHIQPAGRRYSEGRIVAITPLGNCKLIDLQTGSRTFIANGLVSHNSTYIGARFYHRSSLRPNTNAFIIAHEDKATANLYKMVRRYHKHNPLRPSTMASNAQELVFNSPNGFGLDSGYRLATAGSKDSGRSATAQLLHGSEVAFWANAQTHLAGIGNTIALMPGTEVVLESTGNGLGNAFHLMWQKAEAGDGDYIAVFVPWYWQEEYSRPLKSSFSLSDEDVEYQRSYGLTDEQMEFRRLKIAEYGEGFEWLFDQEYPSIPSLAFQTGTKNPLISPGRVWRAVQSGYRTMGEQLLIGCDPAGENEEDGDRTGIAFRRGRVCYRVESHKGLDTEQIAGLLASYNRDLRPDAIFVDKGGLGAGIYDKLRTLRVPVIGVNNASRAHDDEIYENRRAEMWWAMRDWFMDEPCRIPNNATLIADICAPKAETSHNGRKLLESKKKMLARGIRSPDLGDALALTFAEPVVHIPSRPGDNLGSATSAGY